MTREQRLEAALRRILELAGDGPEARRVEAVHDRLARIVATAEAALSKVGSKP